NAYVINVRTTTKADLDRKIAHLDPRLQKYIRGEVVRELKKDVSPTMLTEFSTPQKLLCIHNTQQQKGFSIDGLPPSNAFLLVIGHEISGHCLGQQSHITDFIRHELKSIPHPQYFQRLRNYVATTLAETEADIISMYTYYGLTKDIKGLIQQAI